MCGATSVLVHHLHRAYPHAGLPGYDAGFVGHCLIENAPLLEWSLDRQLFVDLRAFPSSLFGRSGGFGFHTKLTLKIDQVSPPQAS